VTSAVFSMDAGRYGASGRRTKSSRNVCSNLFHAFEEAPKTRQRQSKEDQVNQARAAGAHERDADGHAAERDSVEGICQCVSIMLSHGAGQRE
jgi:hypothetical protein